jgi:hypothetical protein
MKHISLDTNAYATFKSGNANIVETIQCADNIYFIAVKR